MIRPDPRPSPGLARWAESYEAKCERRQETRQSRCCRPNVTTCRQVGKTMRTQQREQLQRARHQQFFQRRRLEVEEKGQAWHPGTRGQALSRRTHQAAATKGPLACTSRISSPGQQMGHVQASTAAKVTETSFRIMPGQRLPPSVIQRDQADQSSPMARELPPQDPSLRKPPKHHRGTQTKVEESLPTLKNDASQQTNYGVAVLDKEIIQLSEYLKEALQRELILKQKMVILQDLLSTLIQASDSSWKNRSEAGENQAEQKPKPSDRHQGQLNEDKLKGKLRSLENQLYTCTQKYSPWGMKKVLLEMEDQKNSYEQKAKESLQKMLEEKMSAEQQLQSTQRSLALAEQKCEEWRSQYEALKEDWRTLGVQHRELESQFHVLQSKLQGADSRDSQMNQALRLLENEHQELQVKIECLQRDRELCSVDTQDLQDQLKKSEEEKLALETRVQQLQNQALSVWSPKPAHQEVEPEGTGKEKDWDLRDQLQKKTLQLQAKEKECRELHSELDNLSDEYLACLYKLQHCREELKLSQQPPPRRQCGPWLPVLMVVTAVALAVFLANKDNLII
ncbi:TRAF3-interacting JNK-activating modulator isoform X2 [Ochotona curzoniae]|uniref:TRAF3-interacting JNK-activating modulator isoform X2 n=1 Tax=Ochotona curzoniae TaxID=130825 RepID=UPI001B34A2FD|nr:TRAF3-interacting JNK-activating modulator isoform X2 [Ochotona curzoniae]